MSTSKRVEKAWISRTAAAKTLGVRRDTINQLIAHGLHWDRSRLETACRPDP